ncbi:hypothetical protein V6N13_137805 [Hibiscus sabdariffa]|uniref:Uncharacterized protein n=1 Tax=Hibiscus sabdariffa TaxID=183260 RepID=A0ABR2DJI6_9ROSI
MLTILLKLVFSIVSTLANLVTWLIFHTTAHCLVLLIHACKVPGESLRGALEQLAGAIRKCFEYFLELVVEQIVELTGSLISSAFNLLIGVVASSASASGAALGTFVDNTRASLHELFTDLPEIAEGFSEMVSTVVTDLWRNCMQALGYVKENA